MDISHIFTQCRNKQTSIVVVIIVVVILHCLVSVHTPRECSIAPSVLNSTRGSWSELNSIAPPSALHSASGSRSKLYAVFSTSTPHKQKPWGVASHYHYVFYAPFTAAAWQRIGFTPLLQIAGSEEEWTKDECLAVIIKYLNKLKANYKFLKPPPANNVMVSQTSRLFASNIFSEILTESDYLVTTDVDLWPFKKTPYVLQPNKTLMVLYADCCGSFGHKSKRFQMFPMAYIGTNVKVWRELLSMGNRTGHLDTQNVSSSIINYFKKEFGTVSSSVVVKGNNIGWYQDQRMISILIHEWINGKGRAGVSLLSRNVRANRIDRIRWNNDIKNGLTGRWDVHLPVNGEQDGQWKKLLSLLTLMYNTTETLDVLSLLKSYREDFAKCVKKHNM